MSSKDFIRKNMWDSSYRPEQMFTRDFLAKLFPKLTIKTEYPVRKLKIDGKQYKNCTLDIAIPSLLIAIRLNGAYHFNSSLQETKDEFQKEALKQAGWKVVDFNHFKMKNLFAKRPNPETVKLAESEIKSELERYDIK